MTLPLIALRARLDALGVDAVLVPRGDEHLGEDVPDAAQRLRHLSGFSGSAGLALVTADAAAVFSDGRYGLQLAAETDPAHWQTLHLTRDPPAAWLARLHPHARLGYDPRTVSEASLAAFLKAGLTPVALPANPVDMDWSDRPAAPATPVQPQALTFAGEPAAAKLARVAQILLAAGDDAAVLTDPASIAWLLNVRARDLPAVPVALCFALVTAAGAVTLFIDPARVPALPGVTLAAPEAMADALAALGGQRVRVNPVTQPAWFAQTLRAAGATISELPDPCLLPKAIKNATEQDGARAAHRRDGVALCRFLHRLAAGEAFTELSAAAALHAERAAEHRFVGDSFPAICGAGPNGAVIHYRATPASDRPIDGAFLLDSGGQYLDGTTDVTRTLWLGAEPPSAAFREHFTRVLKGMIAIATLRFPHGLCGAHIDGFARQALWQAGLDYDHGTGHGVGSFLAVHEGPAGLSRASATVPLEAGMILSDEPGHYRPGEYGIRIENLLLVQRQPDDFLAFETLTLAPIQRALIDTSLLTFAEHAWIDGYHARVRAEIGPELPPDAAKWLADATLALAM